MVEALRTAGEHAVLLSSHSSTLRESRISPVSNLGQWLIKNDFKAEVGHRFRFTAKPRSGWDGVVLCRVTEVIPPKRLSYSWNGGDLETQVTWILEPTPRGTRLRLEHTGFAGVKAILLSFVLGSGWKKNILPRLENVLAGGPASGRVTAECEQPSRGEVT